MRDYWISDFALYGLMEPWPGYEWIRVGDDALLVDIETGEVIRVEYGLFYYEPCCEGMLRKFLRSIPVAGEI